MCAFTHIGKKVGGSDECNSYIISYIYSSTYFTFWLWQKQMLDVYHNVNASQYVKLQFLQQ